jgi:hypothetical protein
VRESAGELKAAGKPGKVYCWVMVRKTCLLDAHPPPKKSVLLLGYGKKEVAF